MRDAMKRTTLISLLCLVSACGTQRSNSSVESSAEAPASPTRTFFTSWELDPAVGLGTNEEVSDAWVKVDEETRHISAQIRWDLFPFAFSAKVVDDSTDDCGHRHLVGHLDGSPQSSAYKTTDIDLTIYNVATSSVACRAGLENEIVLILKTENHDGLKTSSALYKAAAAPIPAADYTCRAVREIDEDSSEVFDILFSKRLRFDEMPHIPVSVYVQSRIESRIAFQASRWSILVNGETARMAVTDDNLRTLTFPSGVLNLEPGNSGIAGTLDSLRGMLELDTNGYKRTVDVFCAR